MTPTSKVTVKVYLGGNERYTQQADYYQQPGHHHIQHKVLSFITIPKESGCKSHQDF